MAIRVALHHRTSYVYEKPATLTPQVVRLRPAPHNRTPIHSYSLTIEPKEHFLNWQQDPHGNYLARIVVPEKAPRLVVTVDLVADLESYNPFDFFLEPDAETYPFEYQQPLAHELLPYLEREKVTPRLAQFIEQLDRTPRRTVDFLVDVNRAVHRSVDYVIRMEPGVQTPEDTLNIGRGSCRDSAWLLCQVLRNLGIAARFVSGYLIQLKPDMKPVDGPPGPSEDFTDLHAWCECYVPGAGWIGLDPTSGLLTAEGHIPLACTPVTASAAPIEGGVEKVETVFNFEMHVERIVDVPRVTKPYSEEDWTALHSFGERVDADLQAADLRLTQGGEPTFVSTEEPDAPEWNTAALGGRKEAIADRLIHRLREAWQPGGLLHHGQGKWYPGEQLPRWALSCYFRRDGIPLWKNFDLLGRSDTNYGHTAEDAERFTRTLIEMLGLQQHGLMPGYEDAWYYMWRERRLPTNVDPLDNRIEDPQERERITRVFRQGLKQTIGWILPLAHWNGWTSGSWFLRDEHCFLIPGDSPMGFRLPLDSQPWVAKTDYDSDYPVDPFAERGPLPGSFRFPLSPPSAEALTAVVREQRRGAKEGAAPTWSDPYLRPQSGESATGIVRTALCAEPRDGRLRIFLPPLYTLETFVELIAAIEASAEALGLPVQIEGYGPPHDPRIDVFRVTPDPGVIEVNVPPVASWSDLVGQTHTLYECARLEKLAAEKFDVDGTHVGSGGGNHLVLGGPTASDSPFLRRPDLLASLLRYFHNHPALSYHFSGRFVGPTSQAPRVDEARNDAVYELEVALAALKRAGPNPPYWIVDRTLRNILVDITGNTHRAEFCIDKMYSPDSSTGRLGLLEFRAFEMPPHEKMASAQHLLLRALLAAFSKKPYEQDLAKWGTTLHDRFMLPYFQMRDLHDVIDDLHRWGYDIPQDWFRPHYEFRFPFYGKFEKDAMSIELRGAIEPWNVLGEEATGSGQTRYVDSSVERIQCRVNGWVEGRHIVTCNGLELPLYPTGTEGESVCGVRYRAWQPPSCLHPTIGIHSPLHFDVYDTWNERAIGGCTYHVVHPGGRANEDRPVNAVAAESRRIARFDRVGHLPGRFIMRKAKVNPHFPLTLDMRTAAL